MAYLMGIDLGTSSVKTLIVDQNGYSISCAAESYNMDVPQIGFAEQDCESLWKATVLSIQHACSQAGANKKEIKSIGLSGQMHGLVILDKDKRPIRPIIIWADQRTKKQVDYLKTLHCEENIRNPMNTGFFLPSLLWVKENEPDYFAQIQYMLLPKDYIRYRLCGEMGTDFSDASGTLLFNQLTQDWDELLIKKLEIKKESLPSCHKSYETAGYLQGGPADMAGLRKGIPVAFGGGDGPMQLIGNGAVTPGKVVTNIGTASQVDVICDFPYYDKKTRVNVFHHAVENRWITMAASLNGGIILNWLKNNIFTDITSYDEMDSCAERTGPGCNGLVFLPYLCGERFPHMDPDAKGILYGLTISHNRDHIIRACMESTVYAFKEGIEVFEQLGIPVGDTIIAAGGGTRSPLWLQIQADILQRQIITIQNTEAACIGAAIAGGVCCGVYQDVYEGCEIAVHASEKITIPNADTWPVYLENYQKYHMLYENNKNLLG